MSVTRTGSRGYQWHIIAVRDQVKDATDSLSTSVVTTPQPLP